MGVVTSGVRGNKEGCEASGVDPKSHRVKKGEGGCEASGVAENPGGGCHAVGRGVKSPQGANTPGVAKGPSGDETPGGPTGAQDRRGEDGRGWGEGDKNSPTAQATRRQGANSGDGTSRGEQQTAEPPATMETVQEDGREGPQPAQSDGVRSKHGALARLEYDRLASEATEGGQANTGVAGREDGHGASENQEGKGTEEEGDETPHGVLPTQKPDRSNTKARCPP